MATATVSAGVAGAPIVVGAGVGVGGGTCTCTCAGAGAGAGAVKGAIGGDGEGSAVVRGAGLAALPSTAGSWGTLACGLSAGRSAGGCSFTGTGTGIWRGSGG